MILVTYHSVTGNTRRVAEAIYQAIPGEKQLLEMSMVKPGDCYDLVFAGFPVMQFRPSREASQFLKTLKPGQKLALFVTHAMFPDGHDKAMSEMLVGVLRKCRTAVPQANLCGFFNCPGELAGPVEKMLAESGIPLLRQFAAMSERTRGHPNVPDLEKAHRFCEMVIHGLNEA
jgi:flavodoxin